MKLANRTHPTEEEMEMYAMHRAVEPIVEKIEEHLLVCENCRRELDKVEQQIRIMQIALRNCEVSSSIQ